MLPKLVIFDCDGVLVDSEHLTNQVLRDDLAERGLDLPLTEVMARFVGGTMAGVRDQARDAGADMPDDWVERIYPKIYASLAANVEAVSGAEQVLDFLDANGVPYAVGSNGRLEKMDITLGRTGMLERFQGRLYSAQNLPNPKPAPDVYLKIAADFGVAPQDAAVIEDSASGAKAGFAAGIPVFGYTADTEAEKLAPHCHALFSDMEELPRLLQEKTPAQG